jgi:hypothetical protein
VAHRRERDDEHVWPPGGRGAGGHGLETSSSSQLRVELWRRGRLF